VVKSSTTMPDSGCAFDSTGCLSPGEHAVRAARREAAPSCATSLGTPNFCHGTSCRSNAGVPRLPEYRPGRSGCPRLRRCGFQNH
jgi:hypothetical protein